MLLEVAADPLAFETWVQVGALLVLGLIGLGFKWLGNRTKEGNEDVAKILKTLTTNNSGSHVKDSLDRIEAEQKRQAETLSEHLKTTVVRDQRLDSIEEFIEQYSEG